MIRVLIMLFLLFTLVQCKKTKEEVQEAAASNFITTGQWKVTNYSQGSSNLTSDFAPYKFQFKENNTVDAIKNNAVEISGTWEGNLVLGTIKSNFVTTASHPLPLLNGTWQITSGSSTFVQASQIINGNSTILRLEKI